MARKSKYTTNVTEETVLQWKAALYVRLSREDGDKDESDSIGNQRILLSNYLITQPDIQTVDYYVDDGYSGTTFDRPGFQKMMEDIKAGVVNCIIVKDLSRLGRNYIEVGKYIEQIFPFMNVRFISVNDTLDSVKNPGQMNTIIVPFKNLINDEYCRDISNKVRSSLNTKRKNGEFIGSFTSYGYMKDPEDYHHLIVDDEVAPVVQKIYKWYLDGMGCITIAKKLNDMGLASPMKYKETKGAYRNPSVEVNGRHAGLWGYSAVKRILKNRIYCGDLVQGVMKVTSYKVHTIRRTPEKEWFISENMHEAIISREDFEKVQLIFQRDHRTSPKKNVVYTLSGYVRCADCGYAMNRHGQTSKNGKHRYEYYLCSTYKKRTQAFCTRHTIPIPELTEAVLKAIQQQVSIAVQVDEVLTSLQSHEKTKTLSRQFERMLEEKNIQRKKLLDVKDSLYIDWKTEVISKEEYYSLKSSLENRINAIEENLRSISKEREEHETIEMERKNSFVENFMKYRNIQTLTREVVVELIDMIYVHENRKITIKFKYRDELKRCVQIAEMNNQIIECNEPELEACAANEI